MGKAKPIPFSTPMVRAVLREKNPKTMTRRVINGYAAEHIEVDVDGSVIGIYDQEEGHVRPAVEYAKYRVGDILWVREEHYAYGIWMQNGKTKTGRQKYRFIGDYKRPVYYCDTLPAHVRLCRSRDEIGYFKRLGRFMPRVLARTYLKVTAVRVERLCEITEEDARKEGISVTILNMWRTAREWFEKLWEAINTDRGFGWDTNPWVWVYSFERCEKPEGL